MLALNYAHIVTDAKTGLSSDAKVLLALGDILKEFCRLLF